MDILKEALTADRPKGFLANYHVELLHESPPSLDDRAALEAALTERAPDLELTSLSEGKATLRLRAPSEGMAPEWTITRAARQIDPGAFFRVLEQSWSWPEGAQLMPRVQHVLRVRDDAIHGLDHRRRVELMQRLGVAVLDFTLSSSPALALHWAPTQQILEPAATRESWIEDDFASPVPGAINVRFYRVDQETVPGDVDFLMDTLGLCAVGLNDLQCHFRGLDPDGVGPVLYNAALYQWDKGAVLETGHSVQGLRDDDEWLCQHELSIAPPERDVVDFDPGFPFSAGEPEETS